MVLTVPINSKSNQITIFGLVQDTTICVGAGPHIRHHRATACPRAATRAAPSPRTATHTAPSLHAATRAAKSPCTVAHATPAHPHYHPPVLPCPAAPPPLRHHLATVQLPQPTSQIEPEHAAAPLRLHGLSVVVSGEAREARSSAPFETTQSSTRRQAATEVPWQGTHGSLQPGSQSRGSRHNRPPPKLDRPASRQR
jgi:hypothetical protein